MYLLQEEARCPWVRQKQEELGGLELVCGARASQARSRNTAPALAGACAAADGRKASLADHAAPSPWSRLLCAVAR